MFVFVVRDMSATTKFTCYFCNQVIENETQQAHISNCGLVLEPCPNKCGSYVQRNMRKRHAQVCQNKINRRSYNDLDQYFSNEQLNWGVVPDGRKISQVSMASSITNQSHTILESKLKELTAKFNVMATRSTDTARIQKMTQATIESLQQNMLAWHKNLKSELELMQKEIVTYDGLKKDNEVTIHNVQEFIKELSNIHGAINAQNIAFKEEQINMREVQNDLKTSLAEMKDFFVQENAVVAALWNDQKLQVEKIVQDNATFEAELKVIKEKIEGLAFDIRTASELSADNLSELRKVERSMTQVKLDVELTEDSLSNIQGLIATTPGRIIWKLTDFAMKLESAKTADKGPLKGPIFYTDDYGYRVRLLVYLNGFKKWKGRYLLACLHVMKGDYDDLLKWPCKIEANILLKDCEYNELPKDYARFITAKRDSPNDMAEEPQESSTQYIFIPHSTLTKSNYLKNDTIFIEIRTNQRSETHI